LGCDRWWGHLDVQVVEEYSHSLPGSGRKKLVRSVGPFRNARDALGFETKTTLQLVESTEFAQDHMGDAVPEEFAESARKLRG
jgi:hypothetical protein